MEIYAWVGVWCDVMGSSPETNIEMRVEKEKTFDPSSMMERPEQWFLHKYSNFADELNFFFMLPLDVGGLNK